MPKHVGSILIFCFIFFAAAHASEADETWPEVDYTAAAEPEEEGLDFTRIKLTGDWGGGRTDMAKKGITFDIDILHSWQGVLSGGRDQSWKHGGSLDYWLRMDFEKMGFWEGAFVEMRAETQYGKFANIASGSLLGVNTDGLFPLPNEHTTTLSHVVFTQFLSKSMGIFFGKIDTLDGDNNAFAGSRGKEDFMNPNMVFNPVTLRTSPYSSMGGGVIFYFPDVLDPDPAILQFSVLGANGQPNRAGWDDDFEDGANYAVEYSQPSRFLICPAGICLGELTITVMWPFWIRIRAHSWDFFSGLAHWRSRKDRGRFITIFISTFLRKSRIPPRE